MRLSWADHLGVSRTLAISDHPHRGTAMALMGVALIVLLQDLLDQEANQSMQIPGAHAYRFWAQHSPDGEPLPPT